MNTHPITLELIDAPAELLAGERALFTLAVGRPAHHQAPALLRQVRCNDRSVVLDTDLFQRDVPLAPGERYQVTFGLTPTAPGQLNLADIRIQADADVYPLAERAVPIRPSAAKAVRLSAEPICTYDEGTKVLVRLEHTGGVELTDLTLWLEPHDRVRAGKTVRHLQRLDAGKDEQWEVVLQPGPVVLVLVASMNGQRVELRETVEVSDTLPRSGGRVFRFLEPRKLTIDQIEIRPLEPEDAPPVASVRGVYDVRGKQHYRVGIQPSHPEASAVRLREVPEAVHVGRTPRVVRGRWEFEVYITASEAWTRSARLFYDVETPGGTLTGEIHLAIHPPPWKRLVMATTLGAAITLQSLGLFVGALMGSESTLEKALAEFNPVNGVQGRHFFQVLSIPGAWAVLAVADWVQYRWRT